MLSHALQFLTTFTKRDEGELSIGHCLAGAAVAVVVVASILSISPDIDRIYGGGATVSQNQSMTADAAVNANQGSPGILAHISQG